MAEQTFSVTGLHCGGCVGTITTALTALKPVSAVSIDLNTEGASAKTSDSQATWLLLPNTDQLPADRNCAAFQQTDRATTGVPQTIRQDRQLRQRRIRDNSRSIALYASKSSSA